MQYFKQVMLLVDTDVGIGNPATSLLLIEARLVVRLALLRKDLAVAAVIDSRTNSDAI